MQNSPKEWLLLNRIKSRVQRQHPHKLVPLGDDGFVFKNFPGNSVLVQDMMVEDVHFRREYFTARDLGHKALAVNLSDIAAMGATPHWVQVSLALTPDLNESWLDEFYIGMTDLADQFGAEIIGGDLSSSPHSLVVDVSIFGSCQSPLTRRGAKDQDLLLCSGPLGLSQTGLIALSKKYPDYLEAKRQHLRPMPRLDLVATLNTNSSSVHALMDCSDGLVNDLLLMTENNLELGCEIDILTLPIHQDTQHLANALSIQASDFALWGGEDFQLLMAVAPHNRGLFPDWSVIGKFNTSRTITTRKDEKIQVIEKFLGWQHFS